MAAATILQVGNDPCRRSLVLARSGFTLLRCEERSETVAQLSPQLGAVDAVIFEASEDTTPDEGAVRLARDLTEAPLILFEGPAYGCDGSSFDLIIPPLTPPALWLAEMSQTIIRPTEILRKSAPLRVECPDVRARRRKLRALSLDNRVRPVALDPIWRPLVDPE